MSSRSDRETRIPFACGRKTVARSLHGFAASAVSLPKTLKVDFWRMACAAASIMLLAGTRPAYATLGEQESTVDADRGRMQAALVRVSSADGYAVHEMMAPTGSSVREFVTSATGRVFAVAWQGPWQPDLRQVLGSYFAEYVQAVNAARGGRARRGPITIEQPDLVIQIGGQPRAFVGRVYLPQMMPAGIDVKSIR